MNTIQVRDYRKLGPDHAGRYLASFAWRYNRRYQLETMIPRFVHSAARTEPMPYRIRKTFRDKQENKCLRFLGVRREPAHDVAGVVTIKEHPTGRVMARARLRMNVEKGHSSASGHTRRGAGHLWILYHQKGETGARLKDHDEGTEDPLVEQGKYEAELEIVWGQERLVKKQLFFIGQNDERTHWEI